MLTVQNIEVSSAYVGGNYWLKKYETKLSLKVRGSYSSDTTITLSDEQTDKIVAFIVETAKESLTFEHAKPMDPPVEEAAPVPIPADVLESL